MTYGYFLTTIVLGMIHHDLMDEIELLPLASRRREVSIYRNKHYETAGKICACRQEERWGSSYASSGVPHQYTEP